MKHTAIVLLVVLLEVVSAVAAYLKERLMAYLRSSGDDNAYDPDFSCC